MSPTAYAVDSDTANAAAVAPMSAPPPTMTVTMPIHRSVFSYRMNLGVIRLSMTYDCWKNNCHGATVVPTMAMMSSMTVLSPDEPPPGTVGSTNPAAIWPAGG